MFAELAGVDVLVAPSIWSAWLLQADGAEDFSLGLGGVNEPMMDTPFLGLKRKKPPEGGLV